MIKEYLIFTHTRYMNPWSSGVTSFNEFIGNSFIIVINLDKMKIHDGKLQVRMKFKQIQAEKQVLVWMPVFQKKLIMDRNMDVSII